MDKKKKKPTPKDVPGNGMARRGAEALVKKQKQRQQIMKDLFGKKKAKKEKK